MANDLFRESFDSLGKVCTTNGGRLTMGDPIVFGHPTDGPELWYFSFADPDLPEGTQFLGAVIYSGPGFDLALTGVGMSGLNPGGEVQGVMIPDAAREMFEPYAGKLMSKADIDAMDADLDARRGAT